MASAKLFPAADVVQSRFDPEVSVAFPPQMFFVSLRYNYEFMADSRAQGNSIALTLTKRF